MAWAVVGCEDPDAPVMLEVLVTPRHADACSYDLALSIVPET